MAAETYEALKTGRSSSDWIFQSAEISDFRGKPVTPILARSLLMLRLASARTASLLAAADVSKSDLAFWWQPLGTDLGLWDTPEDIQVFTDLWTDVGEAKEEVAESLSAFGGEVSVQTATDVLTRSASLTQFSRASLWLLGFD